MPAAALVAIFPEIASFFIIPRTKSPDIMKYALSAAEFPPFRNLNLLGKVDLVILD